MSFTLKMESPMSVWQSYRKWIFALLVTQSCLTLCHSVDCSPPDSSVHGILQARILEWVVILFSIVSSWARDQTWVSCTVDRFFTIWATREVPICPLIPCKWNNVWQVGIFKKLFYPFPVCLFLFPLNFNLKMRSWGCIYHNAWLLLYWMYIRSFLTHLFLSWLKRSKNEESSA